MTASSVVINCVLSSETTLLMGRKSSGWTILVFTHNHNLKYQHYNDDLQLICLDASSLATTVHRIERCIDDMKEWMTWN